MIQDCHVTQLLHIIIITLLIAILYPSVVYYDQLLGACHTLISYHYTSPGWVCLVKDNCKNESLQCQLFLECKLTIEISAGNRLD